ncbi:Proteasome assembly chaperone 4 isoform X2 [Aix galericulata]|nr:Proteasome assembly chaperone 4 isoform X2 [Aix galericulata]
MGRSEHGGGLGLWEAQGDAEIWLTAGLSRSRGRPEGGAQPVPALPVCAAGQGLPGPAGSVRMEEGKEGKEQKEEAVAGSGIVLHDFSGRLGEQRVHFHAMRLRDSLFLWVGSAPALASLAVAMCSPRVSIPVPVPVPVPVPIPGGDSPRQPCALPAGRRARVHIAARGPLGHRLRLPGAAPGYVGVGEGAGAAPKASCPGTPGLLGVVFGVWGGVLLVLQLKEPGSASP